MSPPTGFRNAGGWLFVARGRAELEAGARQSGFLEAARRQRRAFLDELGRTGLVDVEALERAAAVGGRSPAAGPLAAPARAYLKVKGELDALGEAPDPSGVSCLPLGLGWVLRATLFHDDGRGVVGPVDTVLVELDRAGGVRSKPRLDFLERGGPSLEARGANEEAVLNQFLPALQALALINTPGAKLTTRTPAPQVVAQCRAQGLTAPVTFEELDVAEALPADRN